MIVTGEKGEILMVERKQYNPGFAPPAGHLDGLTPVEAVKKELTEEVGLVADDVVVKFTVTLPNPCKRDGGTYHEWTVVAIPRWHGEVQPSQEETKQAQWIDRATLDSLVQRLEDFTKSRGLSLDVLPALVRATNEDPDWKAHPGLEPPWYHLLKMADII
ncbi:MAG: NUDIX domain-containing protein [Parcubacteria group bacterium]|nr:NUDIX domain-containing protein [Parcubacteria group bacterium]